MIRFDCDYLEGAHPAILQRLAETNMDQTLGYGEDPYCAAAAEKIRKACAAPDAAVHFLVGGTQTNTTVIYSILRPHEGVLAVSTGHINCHEVNAIEGTGHKVLAIPGENGKLTAQAIEDAYLAWKNDASWEHIVKPGMVYVSQSTETGTLYTKAELEAIRKVCDKYSLPLFLDGARLGYALAADGCDLTLPDIARLCDVFYIGGTKQGALFGEAVVIPDPGLIPAFRSLIKQRGGLLAKGRLLGIQFDVLFTDDLYFSISKNAIATANRLKAGFAEKGYRFFMDSPTNQIFLVLENAQLAALEGKAKFGFWEKFDDTHTVVRIATSWATRMDEVEALIDLM